jgi:hypothetical protein
MDIISDIGGVVCGMFLSAFLHESIVVNKLMQEPKVDYNNNNNNNNSPIYTQTRQLQERLDNCAQQLDQAVVQALETNHRQQHHFQFRVGRDLRHALYYMDEWVDYHLALGFKTIYIYDNSDD